MKKLTLATLFTACSLWPATAQQVINPLTNASWHQKYPFNSLCPDNSKAGCGAIAVGQILYYYKMPLQGFGHVIYNNVDVDLQANPIDWDNICATYPSGGFGDARDLAVANLISQVGAAMKMKYGSSSSPHNFPSMMWGLQHYLHFAPQSRYRHRKYYSTAEWTEMINAELEAGRPVFYRGDHTAPGTIAGHMYVIDGRDAQGHYHVNFGHASKNEDKYVDLNIINQGEGTWPGIYSVSYHHRQAMVTDFYPVSGLTDSDYDPTALVLNSPMVLGGQPGATTVVANKSVQAKFSFRYVNFIGGACQFALGFYKNGQLAAVTKTVRNTSLTDGGFGVNVDRAFQLPDQLAGGDYEMSLVSRDDEDSPWVRGWENAPNKIAVHVNNGTYTFTIPDYHCMETPLFMEDGTIREVNQGQANGKTLELTLCNASSNNFEDSLRLEVTANGVKKKYEMATSVYDGQKLTYRFFVSYNDLDTSNGFMAKAFYRETTTGLWIPLGPHPTGMASEWAENGGRVEIYNTNGVLVRRVERQDIHDTYDIILGGLPKGIYIIRENNATRKFVKRQ